MMKLLPLLVVVGMVGMTVAGEAPAWRITLQKGNEHVSVRLAGDGVRRTSLWIVRAEDIAEV